MTPEALDHLRTLLTAAALPEGPFTWEQVYGMGDGSDHWALCDPASTAEGCVTDIYLVLLASWPTWSDDAPETWNQPVSSYPRLALVAALLTHAQELLAMAYATVEEAP